MRDLNIFMAWILALEPTISIGKTGQMFNVWKKNNRNTHENSIG